jgi:hypothetical protein
MAVAAVMAAAGAAWGQDGIAGQGEARGLNLLYFGNSYTHGTGSTRTVPLMVSDIAQAAGRVTPNTVMVTAGGATLWQHNIQSVSAITTRLDEGQRWDRVILQDQSTMNTIFGSVEQHRMAFVALVGKVRDHSPLAKVVGYQTWSRAPSHPYFTGPQPFFPRGAAEMTEQIRDGYNLSTADANAMYGAGTSSVARVGEAWQAANWERLHISDLSHAQNRGSLLAAMVLYASIYDDATVQDIDYTAISAGLGLGAADSAFLSSAAQRTIGTVTPGHEIYWTNAATGANVVWRTDSTPEDGTFVVGSAALASIGDARWRLCARADINVDGAMDLVWRHAETGEVRAWLMDAGAGGGSGGVLSSVGLGTVSDARWELRAAADLDLDGIADLIWRHAATGENAVWMMDAPSGSGDNLVPGGVKRVESLARVSDPYWQIEGAADLDGDDRVDLVWRNVRTGATAVWSMDGLAYRASVEVTPRVADVNWRVAAIADYDEDGKSDLVWRNLATGAMELWLMDGVSRRSVVEMPTVGDSAWRTLGQGAFASGPTRDFDGDGHSDILWRHALNGRNAVWRMREGAFVGLESLETIDDAAWKVAGVGDVTRDNVPDIVWRHATTGQNVAWIMDGRGDGLGDGLGRRGVVELPRVSDVAWEVGAIVDVDGDETSDVVWVNGRSGECVAWIVDGTPQDGSWVRAVAVLERMPTTRHRVVGGARVGLTSGAGRSGAYELLVRDLDATPGGNGVAGYEAWVMGGATRSQARMLPPVVDGGWVVASAMDLTGDGVADVLWRHAVTGENVLWGMSASGEGGGLGGGLGGSVGAVMELPRVEDGGWEVAR